MKLLFNKWRPLEKLTPSHNAETNLPWGGAALTDTATTQILNLQLREHLRRGDGKTARARASGHLLGAVIPRNDREDAPTVP